MSPIIGLTDTVAPSFPRIGRLRKGGAAPKDQSGNSTRMGQDLEYFRFVSERADVQAAFEGAYGDKPALITVYLPYADAESNFSCWKEEWGAGGLLHRCNGQTMTIWQDDKGQYNRTPKPCTGKCKEVGRLSLVIPQLLQEGFVGYVVLETHGKHDLMSIQASLMQAAEARIDNSLGLRGIRWSLRRDKERVSTPMGNGKRGRRDKWMVKLVPEADWVQLQIQAAHNTTMMLPAQTVDMRTGEIKQEQAAIQIIDSMDTDIPAQTPFDYESAFEDEPTAEAPPFEMHNSSDALICAKCGKNIYEIKDFTAAQVAEKTEQKWGAKLCHNCHTIKRIDDEARKAAAKPAAKSG